MPTQNQIEILAQIKHPAVLMISVSFEIFINHHSDNQEQYRLYKKRQRHHSLT